VTSLFRHSRNLLSGIQVFAFSLVFLGGYKGGRKAPIIAAYRIELTDEFKKKLAKRLKKPSGRISHKEVLEEFGQD